jgi:hypothetical protein
MAEQNICLKASENISANVCGSEGFFLHKNVDFPLGFEG